MPLLARRLPIARSEGGGMCLHRQVWPRDLHSGDMTHEDDAAPEPGIPRVEQQIDETHDRRQQDAAFAAVQTLLTHGHGGIFIHGERGVGPPVFVPIAIMSVVIVMML